MIKRAVAGNCGPDFYFPAESQQVDDIAFNSSASLWKFRSQVSTILAATALSAFRHRICV